MPSIGAGSFVGSVGLHRAFLQVVPHQGVMGDIGLTVVSGSGSGVVTVGDYSLEGGGIGQISGGARLCSSSLAASCGTTSVYGSSSLVGKVTLTGPDGLSKVVAVTAPDNLSASLKADDVVVSGTVGGTVTVGSRTFGRIRQVEIYLPRPSAVTLASAKRQGPGFASSQQAALGEKVKTAVRAAKHRAQRRHAAAD
jgi:hypothetical protein